MTEEPTPSPSSRSWRDIPQPVKPRAMTRGGKWRHARPFVLGVAGGVLALGLGWASWKIAAALQGNSRIMPALAKAVPIKPPELITDGVLDEAWLARTLALPHGASLMELDLDALRARLLAERQIITASLTQQFPDRLIVRVSERTPVVRLKAAWRGREQELLVARDGVAFAGTGHDPDMIATLPWLAGARLSPQDDGLAPIDGMEPVSELLAQAQLHARHLYATWQIVSIQHLAPDQEIEVRTREGAQVVFGAKRDYFGQLARLDYLWDKIGNSPDSMAQVARMDLSLGREVPVELQLAPTPQEAARGRARPPANPVLPSRFVLPTQPKSKREL